MLTDERKRKLAEAWYSEDWAIDKAVAMIESCEAEVRKEQADRIAELTRQLAEADRRAGAAEREMAESQKSAIARNEWLFRAKRQWGVDDNVSFDVVWAECLELKEQLAEARKGSERYRWVRDDSVPPHNFYLSVPAEFHGERYKPQEVDAYIDAAIKAKEQP